MNQNEIVSFLWGTADLIRDHFKRGKYQDVILPLTVLRRLDCVLAPTREKVWKRNSELKGRVENLDGQLRKASGFAFYNTSKYDFTKLKGEAPALAANLRRYIAGFSPNMREVLERFDFDNTIKKLDESGLLFQVVERFAGVDLHPSTVPNTAMGTVFEELIRKFNEALDENPGEHFTPRDVVHLMVDLLIAGDRAELARRGKVITVFDPCCGTGGMLTIAKERIAALNPGADIHLFGQEVNPETFAVAKSDLFMKSEGGRDAERIEFGSTLSNDRHAGRRFDYVIANPPYGKDWKQDQKAVEAEHERGAAGRFAPGLPRISDGQLLFLLHMLAHRKPASEGGSRIAIIMNGSPLFTGDAGSGESEIRRHILENDWLETLIALPEQLFYNTGIATYVWVISNRKPKARRGKVLLIDASSLWEPMRKSLGDKRRQIPAAKIAEIVALHEAFSEGGEGDRCRIFPTTHFGYRKITVERPLRLEFRAIPERIARIVEETAFRKLAESKKKSPKERAADEAAGRVEQEAIRGLLRALPPASIADREALLALLRETARQRAYVLKVPIEKAIVAALSERDENAAICRDKDGRPEPDSELRDFENVPLAETVADYFEREVRPYIADAWINESVRDEKDGEIGRVGYEINFNRYFYKYVPPRPLAEIQADLRTLEAEIVEGLREVVGGEPAAGSAPASPKRSRPSSP